MRRYTTHEQIFLWFIQSFAWSPSLLDQRGPGAMQTVLVVAPCTALGAPPTKMPGGAARRMRMERAPRIPAPGAPAPRMSMVKAHRTPMSTAAVQHITRVEAGPRPAPMAAQLTAMPITAVCYHRPPVAVYPGYHPPITVNYYGSGCYNCGGWSTGGAAAAGAAVGMVIGASVASANTAAASCQRL